MDFLVCLSSFLGTIFHYAFRLPKQFKTFTSQIRDITERGFIYSLEINRNIVVSEYVTKPNYFSAI